MRLPWKRCLVVAVLLGSSLFTGFLFSINTWAMGKSRPEPGDVWVYSSHINSYGQIGGSIRFDSTRLAFDKKTNLPYVESSGQCRAFAVSTQNCLDFEYRSFKFRFDGLHFNEEKKVFSIDIPRARFPDLFIERLKTTSRHYPLLVAKSYRVNLARRKKNWVFFKHFSTPLSGIHLKTIHHPDQYNFEAAVVVKSAKISLDDMIGLDEQGRVIYGQDQGQSQTQSKPDEEFYWPFPDPWENGGPWGRLAALYPW